MCADIYLKLVKHEEGGTGAAKLLESREHVCWVFHVHVPVRVVK
jgi:hypothetical protein